MALTLSNKCEREEKEEVAIYRNKNLRSSGTPETDWRWRPSRPALEGLRKGMHMEYEPH
jgi:hypothetical protein